jgi:hypothetical protein
MVCKSIRHALKRFAIPFATVSTASLLMTFHKVKAATLVDSFLKNGSVQNGYYSAKSIQERGGGLGEFRHLFENMDKLTEKFINVLDWFNNLPVSLPKLTADLLTAIYHFISKIVLETPLLIFNNPYLKNTSLTFALISITIVTLLTVFEAIMQMLNKEHTDFKTIIKRWLFAASISGFLPFAFETGFDYINKLSTAISHIGGINGGNANGFIYMKRMGFFDTLFLCLFDLTAISMLIPICLQAGRRWWDLLCLCAVSPLALSARVFDRHKHFFTAWWSRVKSLSLVQLVYSVFILLMGVFVFTTQHIHGGFFTLIIKVLLVLGGLTRLANPPGFVTRLTGDKSDIFDEYDKTKGTFMNVWNTLTLKNMRPVQFLKKQKANKLAKIKSLQKKHGRRFVGDLL